MKLSWQISFFSFKKNNISRLNSTLNNYLLIKELISVFRGTPKCFCNMQQRPSLSVDRIYLHFSSYSNSARGCLSSDLTAHKLHRLFNHNCLHTILHHTSWLCICILWHPGCIYPSVTSSGLTVRFDNRGLFSAALQRWCWVSCSYPGWLPLIPPLPLRLCFTADRRSARAPPARVIYDQQLLLQPMTHTAGCQMWSPCKQKLIWQPNISRRLDRERG